MWTPRRILLLFAMLFFFGILYAGYARFLGRIDGLPVLPTQYLEFDDEPLPEILAVESPTIVKLREAFGENCPEMGAAYPTRLEIREQGVVFAAGMPQIGSEPTKFVRLAPLSVALFGKPKPLHERLPGEVPEINTLHSDEGILEFDRPISSDRDMLAGKAKLIGIELRSNPDLHNNDPRNGRIVISNNQRLADPGRFFVMKTPGPVFYRTADHPEANNSALPHVWTTAAVEIVNRDNLPRPLRGAALPIVAVPSDDSLPGSVVAEMALGLHTSPPTVTADGMKLFMKKSEPTPGKRNKEGGFSGLREMILTENVLFSLWIDGASGFPGSDAKQPVKTVPLDPPLATAGLLGGLHDGAFAAQRVKSKALLRIRTLGAFRYDMAANVAKFEVAPQPNPLLPNNVELMRFLPAGGKDYLICQKLEIEFLGSVTGGASAKKGASTGFKKLTATGDHVLIAAATEQFQAQGTALIYETDPARRLTTTTLHGAPLSAVRNQSVLIAGRPGAPSSVVFASIEPAPGSKDAKITDVVINGPGRVELFNDTTHEKTLTAVWQKSLTQSRETVDGLALDRFIFTGDGEFIDAQGRFNLKGDVMKLWLKAGAGTASASSAVPHRLMSLGHVEGHSADAIIENTDALSVLFVDVAKPVVVAGPPTVAPAGPAPIIQPVARAPKDKAKPNPVRMSARVLDITLHRQVDKDPKAASQYEMQEATCTDRVIVLQPSSDLKKAPIGIDIRGGGLLMKKQANGHAMTVTGTANEIARVRFENTTICGPSVYIDQPSNSVAVTGGGWMRMPASSSMAGAAVDQKSEITVHWQTRMKFLGERRWAEFVGQVHAVQAQAEGILPMTETISKSSIACHELNVTFDKPIFFNNLKSDAKQPEGDPKIQTVVCTPASEDAAEQGGHLVLYLEETTNRLTKKIVKAQQIEAKLLEVRVKENQSEVTGIGPGITRILQMGSKDDLAQSPTKGAKPEAEMKLTHVRFNGRLELTDQKGIFQKAIFRESVRVAQVPTENLNLPVGETSVRPPRSMFLKCNDTFMVSSYRAKSPGGEETKSMEAVDGAEVTTDDYIGLGHTITFDGTQVILRGYKDGQATLYRNLRTIEGRDYKSGNPLIYNTKTGQISGAGSSGGQITAPK